MKGLWRKGALACALMAIGLLAVPQCRADEPIPGSDWTFSVAPYLWLAGVNGGVTGPRGNSANFDASIGDVLDHFQGGLMLLGEVRNRRWGVFADFDYVHLEGTKETFNPLLGQPSASMKQYLGTLTGEYRFFDSNAFTLDGMFGVRVMSINTELSFSGALLPPRSDNGSTTWADPIVGLKARLPFGDSGFFANAYFDVGGGPNEDLTYQAYGGFGYSFDRTVSAFVGYRYLVMEHQDGNLSLNLNQQGPLIGVDFRF
jgi:hypothetical protein